MPPPAPVPGDEVAGAVIAGLRPRAPEAGVGGPPTQRGPGALTNRHARLGAVHEVHEGEQVVHKAERDAFAGTSPGGLLPQDALPVMTGVRSEYCVRATALSALAQVRTVTLVAAGHSTYDDGCDAAATQALPAAAGVTVAAQEDVRF